MLRCIITLIILVLPVSANESSSNVDVRVIVDISGSMKKNDPQNLRVPAVQLLNNLLPPKTKAGIWTFGQYVNNNLAVSVVDDKWRAAAARAASEINSKGAFTNIPDALLAATKDWKGPDETQARHLILLTDGVVDISPDAAENVKARQRLLNDWLPMAKTLGLHLHTIALSTEADAELLGRLSRETDALFEMVESAEALNKVFLRIFEQSTPRDTVPLNNNRFVIDVSVEEFTLLVFKKSAREVKLVAPDGTSSVMSQTPSGWKWYSDARYELITVPKPATGEWQLDADVDPDNRVMVVSNLALNVKELPRSVLSGEQLALDMSLLDAGQPVSNNEFLSLVQSSADIQFGEQNQSVGLMSDVPGHYSAAWQVPDTEGVVQLQLKLESPTFVRTRTFTVQIIQGKLQLKAGAISDAKHHFEVEWTADVFADTPHLTAQLLHGEQVSDVAVQIEAGKALIMVESKAMGRYQLKVKAQGKGASGRHVNIEATSDSWDVAGAAEPVNHATAEEPTKIEEQSPVMPEPEVEAESSLWLYVAVAINVLLVLGGSLLWWIIRRKQRIAAVAIDSELGEKS